MKKNEYQTISDNKNLPLRCPILNRCERRAFTIFAVSYFKEGVNSRDWENYLIKKGELSDSYTDLKIESQGEQANVFVGKNNQYGSFSSLCPEVNLFDSRHRLINPPVSWVAGSWDKETNGNSRIIPTEFKHFSECAEYCMFCFDRNRKNDSMQTLDKNEIKELLINDISAGIEKLKDLIKSEEKYNLFNNLILISSDFKSFRNNKIKGILTADESRIIHNQILNRILDLIDEI